MKIINIRKGGSQVRTVKKKIKKKRVERKKKRRLLIQNGGNVEYQILLQSNN